MKLKIQGLENVGKDAQGPLIWKIFIWLDIALIIGLLLAA